jgi:site-specific DNA-methyltransferase (adenine-specific)
MRGFLTLQGNVQTRDFLKARLGKNGEVMVKKDANVKETYVKFDCIVGNPPYQKSNGGAQASADSIYPEFVYTSMRCNPKYLSMVIPARWMNGSGKHLAKDFLSYMISCKKLANIAYIEDATKWFPNVDIKGGCMYFLIESDKKDSIVMINGFEIDLENQDVILTNPIDIGIKNKVLKTVKTTFDAIMHTSHPYGIRGSYKHWVIESDDSFPCHCSGGAGKGETVRFVRKSEVKKNKQTIGMYKVCVSKGDGKGRDGINNTFIVKPNAIVSGSYLVVDYYDNPNKAKNSEHFLRTRFAQYFVSLLKATQDMSPRVFNYLPYLDFTRSYADDDLYSMFNLTEDEIKHIENFVKDFPMFREAKPAKAPKVKAESKPRKSKSKPEALNLDSIDFDKLANAI